MNTRWGREGGMNWEMRFDINIRGCMLSQSVVSDSFVTPWTVAHQAPLSMEFFRQECWIGLSFPTPRDLPDPGNKPASLVSPALTGGFCTIVPKQIVSGTL